MSPLLCPLQSAASANAAALHAKHSIAGRKNADINACRQTIPCLSSVLPDRVCNVTLALTLQADLKKLSLEDPPHRKHHPGPESNFQYIALMQPMQRYMLPCLPLEAIASLRASCNTLQVLVDTAPAEAWQPAASASLLPTSMRHVSDLFNGSQDVQSMLLGQGLVTGNLRTGASRLKSHHIVHENTHMQASSLHWSPG